jgi:hypothetical protein
LTDATETPANFAKSGIVGRFNLDIFHIFNFR